MKKKMSALAGQTLPRLVLFELVFKALTWIIFRPAMGFIVQLTLTVSGYQLAFNNFIAGFFLTVPGLVAAVLLLALSAVFTWFEFSVLILLAGYGQQGQRIGWRAVLLQAARSGKNLLHPSTLGYLVYVLGLLPVVNVGLTSSLLPQLTIPNFITGELGKTLWGPYVLGLAVALVLLLFFATLFVLPTMVLAGQSFGRAFVGCFGLLRRAGARLLPVYASFLLTWGVLFALPRQVFTRVFGTPNVGIQRILTVFGFSWQALALLLLALVLWLVQLLLLPVLLSILVRRYSQIGGTVVLLALQKQQLARPFAWTRVKALAHTRHFKKVRNILVVVLVLALGNGIAGVLYQPPGLHQPIVIGHRGSAYGVENTLEALQGAIDAGSEYTEIDVLLSADGVPVVVHDSNLSRLAGLNVNVYDLTAEELGELTLLQNGYEGKINTLAEVLQFCDGKIKLAIELKKHGQEKESLVENSLAVINQYNFLDRCIFISLEYTLLEELKEAAPSCVAGYCVYGNVGSLHYETLMSMVIDFVVIEEAMATRKTVSQFRDAWLPVYVWTVNDGANMYRYLDMGIVGLVTDYPDLAMEVLKDFNASSGNVYLPEEEWRD